MSLPWLVHFNTTLDKLENAARSKINSAQALAEATHALSMLETQLTTFSAAQHAQLQASLPSLLARLSTVTSTLENERSNAAAELTTLRTRANAFKSYSNK